MFDFKNLVVREHSSVAVFTNTNWDITETMGNQKTSALKCQTTVAEPVDAAKLPPQSIPIPL